MKHISALLLLLCAALISHSQVNHVVISQVYGGGGNSGSTYRNDFIELFNPTTSTVNLNGWTLQYASSSGTAWNNQIPLSGSIAPGQYFLVRGGAGGQGTTDLPTPDASGALNLSGTSGKLALVRTADTLPYVSCPTSATIVDLVGFGSANCFEGSVAPGPNTTNAIFRRNGGCQDNNNNGSDFTAAPAAPRNSSSPFNFCAAATCAPTNAPTSLTLTPAQNSVSGSFTAAAPGSVAATGYIVLATTASYLTELPANGAVYNVDDDLGNAKVVAYGSATSFTASSLLSATTYNFFVYGFSGAGCHNTGIQLRRTTTTLTPPPCTPPSAQASNFSVSNVTASSVDLSFQRGNGTAVLVLYKAATAVDADPTNGTAYTTGTQIGAGNFVAYAGTQNAVSVSGLQQNTVYHFAVYEYNSADNCYQLSELTGTATTACGYPSPVTALNGTSGNGQVSLTWTLPATTVQNGGCYNEILILASTSTISADASAYSSTAANANYGSGVQLVYRGSGTSVTVTGLTNNTTYYFRAYSRRGTEYTPVTFAPQVFSTPFNPSSGYVYLYGNLHGHSSYSDGNKEDLSKTPKDDYEYARDAECMDFLGLSEHNHSGAGMVKSNYPLGFAQANQVNMLAGPGGNQLVTLWGMEWGVSSSGGGHVLIYGFDDKLVGWEAGNYDIFCAKNDYTSLWSLINNKPGAFAALAHPGFSDYGDIVDAYNAAADNAIYGMAVESGPALSNTTSYNNYPSSLSHLEYYKAMLAKGYRLAPQMDQDNHYMTFGTINRNRMVVMATEKSRTALVDAVRNMRFYASNDCNAKVQFTLGSAVMGGSAVSTGAPAMNINITDTDAGEGVSSIEVWGGQVGVDSARLRKTFTGQASVAFSGADAENIQANNTTWYYFAIITQADGNKMVTAPIWYSRNDGALPVTLVNFAAAYRKSSEDVLLTWATAQEEKSDAYVIERSTDNGRSWLAIGKTKAAGHSQELKRYSFTDAKPAGGKSYYRLKMIDQDLSVRFSDVKTVQVGKAQQISIYPSPSSGPAYVLSTRGGNMTITVTDANGKQVNRKNYLLSANAPVRIDLSGLGNGYYFVTVSDNQSSFTQKLTIIK
jgi:hypothetical protein